VRATLYGSPPSHPSHAARLMLEHKGIEHRTVWLLPGLWPFLLRTRGFRGGTVPALKLNGRRIQHSCEISRALDEAKPQPPLFPADPELRHRVEGAERWGEQDLQPLPRRIYRWAALTSQSVREAIARDVGMPAPPVMAALNKPVAWYLAHKVGADDDGRIRAELSRLPSLLDRADALIAENVIGGESPNAADFQIGASLRVLLTIEDLAPALGGRPASELARRLMPAYPGGLPAETLPSEWLAPLRGAQGESTILSASRRS
jgi:glutathione S-transferase